MVYPFLTPYTHKIFLVSDTLIESQWFIYPALLFTFEGDQFPLYYKAYKHVFGKIFAFNINLI